jgi:hypothetical protein
MPTARGQTGCVLFAGSRAGYGPEQRVRGWTTLLPMGEDASDRRKGRLARNEAFFREANEVIEGDGMKQRFICECSSEGCMERLPLSPVEYEHARTQGDWFIIVPGHEDASVEIVVERTPTHLIVQKIGLAGAIASSEDPR